MNHWPVLDEYTVCVRCTGVGDAHKLTCPVLSLPPGFSVAADVAASKEASQ